MISNTELYSKLKAFVKLFIDETKTSDQTNDRSLSLSQNQSKSQSFSIANSMTERFKKIDLTVKISKQDLYITNMIITQSLLSSVNLPENDIIDRLEPILPYIKSDSFEITYWSEKELARQITLSTFYLYTRIDPFELVSASTSNSDKFEYCTKCVALVNRFNKLSLWIQEEILAYDNTYQRALVVAKIIDLANELRKMKNFNDMVNVVYALNSNSVSSLVKTFNKLDNNKKNLLNELSTFSSSANDFALIREAQSKVDISECCIPYFGLILKDINNYQQTMKYYESENESLINFDKILKIGSVVNFFERFKRYEYMFKPCFKLGFLSDPEVFSEDELVILSEKLGKSILL